MKVARLSVHSTTVAGKRHASHCYLHRALGDAELAIQHHRAPGLNDRKLRAAVDFILLGRSKQDREVLILAAIGQKNGKLSRYCLGEVNLGCLELNTIWQPTDDLGSQAQWSGLYQNRSRRGSKVFSAHLERRSGEDRGCGLGRLWGLDHNWVNNDGFFDGCGKWCHDRHWAGTWKRSGADNRRGARAWDGKRANDRSWAGTWNRSGTDDRVRRDDGSGTRSRTGLWPDDGIRRNDRMRQWLDDRAWKRVDSVLGKFEVRLLANYFDNSSNVARNPSDTLR